MVTPQRSPRSVSLGRRGPEEAQPQEKIQKAESERWWGVVHDGSDLSFWIFVKIFVSRHRLRIGAVS